MVWPWVCGVEVLRTDGEIQFRRAEGVCSMRALVLKSHRRGLRVAPTQPVRARTSGRSAAEESRFLKNFREIEEFRLINGYFWRVRSLRTYWTVALTRRQAIESGGEGVCFCFGEYIIGKSIPC